ncbi:hypothetical protein BGP84_19640 [Pseudomonas putida]|uniref:Gamma-butyrobetaine hydroxylase-like N-terminal domain-containing protein n=1 Tax=Pseudomonas putida TaxID=303 RepID=A0A2S3WUL4_PSEPU|nr:gamma-butyrobetaine hydroxylase-like domain-containing protein [Pseudomonas putida]POG05108.1 hypothetical protein BGP84_19640 [Pseudomonas putida]POG07843.1 hypothetical protein BGP85_13685 [Pseudomonas putida]
MDSPSAIRNQRENGLLTLQWVDTEAVISHARLRGACPCSQCRAAGLQGRVPMVRADIRIERIVAQGYGVQLVFSDGHERGIYPWQYLRELG